jgi:hypothetical protein
MASPARGGDRGQGVSRGTVEEALNKLLDADAGAL